MRYPASEKLEIIRLVEGSRLPVKRTLEKLGISRSKFCRWYDLHRPIAGDEYDNRASEPKALPVELAMRIEQHQKGEDGFRTTLESLISVASRSAGLFERSKTEQKRELIAFVFSNLELKGEKLEFSLRSPFDLMVDRRSYASWLGD